MTDLIRRQVKCRVVPTTFESAVLYTCVYKCYFVDHAQCIRSMLPHRFGLKVHSNKYRPSLIGMSLDFATRLKQVVHCKHAIRALFWPLNPIAWPRIPLCFGMERRPAQRSALRMQGMSCSALAAHHYKGHTRILTKLIISRIQNGSS